MCCVLFFILGSFSCSFKGIDPTLAHLVKGIGLLRTQAPFPTPTCSVRSLCFVGQVM